MRRWAWDLDCPKCGTKEMTPNWTGHEERTLFAPREFLQIGFSAECVRCGYEEEVLPLDAQEAPTEEALSELRDRFEAKHTGPRP